MSDFIILLLLFIIFISLLTCLISCCIKCFFLANVNLHPHEDIV